MNITVNKETLINLIQSFIKQGDDDQINFGQTLSPEEYNSEIELQLKIISGQYSKQIELDSAVDKCDMCNHYDILANAVDKMIEESEDVRKLQSYPGYLANL